MVMVMLLAMFGTAEPGHCWPSRPRRPVFLRECTAPTTHYRVSSYFLSRFTMEAIPVALQVLLQCNEVVPAGPLHDVKGCFAELRQALRTRLHLLAVLLCKLLKAVHLHACDT